MRELLRWLFNISGKELDNATDMLSKDTAKQRLKLVLIQDRLELAPEKLEEMKKDIWEVVSKYMVVNDDFMEFEVRRLDDLTVLVSNIEVKDLSDPDPGAIDIGFKQVLDFERGCQSRQPLFRHCIRPRKDAIRANLLHTGQSA